MVGEEGTDNACFFLEEMLVCVCVCVCVFAGGLVAGGNQGGQAMMIVFLVPATPNALEEQSEPSAKRQDPRSKIQDPIPSPIIGLFVG